MGESTPFFSVVIPTYNRGHLIKSTIQSALNQRFLSFEIIVVDDGSTDNTEEVVGQFDDRRISYFLKQNGERGAARNFGWNKAQGEYVTFLDSDDILYADHFQCAFESLKKLSFPPCFAQGFQIKEFNSGKVLWNGYNAKQPLINAALLKGNFLACFGVFIKVDIRSEVVFEEERRFAGTEDWLLWLQLAARHPFYFENNITGALIHHRERSVLSMDNDSLLFRPAFIREKLQHDKAFIKKFGPRGVAQAYAHVLSYVSLNLAIAKKNKMALRYLLQTLNANPKEFFTKRTLGIFKSILLK